MSEETVLLKDLFKSALKQCGRPKRLDGGLAHNARLKEQTGFKNTYKVNCISCGRKYMYQYVAYKNGKTYKLSSVSILNLKQKVIDKGFDWKMTNKYWADKTATAEKVSLKELK